MPPTLYSRQEDTLYIGRVMKTKMSLEVLYVESGFEICLNIGCENLSVQYFCSNFSTKGLIFARIVIVSIEQLYSYFISFPALNIWLNMFSPYKLSIKEKAPKQKPIPAKNSICTFYKILL